MEATAEPLNIKMEQLTNNITWLFADTSSKGEHYLSTTDWEK